MSARQHDDGVKHNDMDTLPNVNITEVSQCAEPAFSAIPEARSSHTGVSVEYAHDADKKWFVFRASYGREDIAADLLIEEGVYAYVPKRYKWREVNGRPKKVLENLISNLVFAYLNGKEADIYVRNNDPLTPSPNPRLSTIISYYYDHFTVMEYGKNPPLTVSDEEMRNFILATRTHDENLMLLQPGGYRFKGDDEVLVTVGPFKGVRGRVVRANRQQRVLVRLSGVCLCTTAYIPSPFLERIDS